MKLFLDSTVLVDVIVARNSHSLAIFNSHSHDLFLNEYVIKEVRWVLKRAYHHEPFEIEKAFERIDRRCIVLPAPSVNRYKKLELSDKADRPILCSSLEYDCILVTNDRLLLKEARKYVTTLRPEDIPLSDE